MDKPGKRKIELDFYEASKGDFVSPKSDRGKDIPSTKMPLAKSKIPKSKFTPERPAAKSIKSRNKVINNDLTKVSKDKKKKKFLTKKKLFFCLPLLIILAGIIGAAVYFGPTLIAAGKSFNVNPLPALIDKVIGNKPTLNSTNGKVNFLILGVDNRADTLTNDLKQVGNTDTMMMISYDTTTSKVSFLSIPRDIGIRLKFPSGQRKTIDKINAAVNVGASQNYPGGGAQLLRDTLKDMTGIDINYTVVVNFDAFVQIIDSIGGVDVNVENSFCDAGYPVDATYGVKTVKFNKGPQHMDGKIALEFARSRVHNECANMTAGDPIFEGTDFRRAYRQQQVIKAAQDKISASGLDIDKIQKIIQAIGNNLLTEIGNGAFGNDNKIDLQTLQSAFDLKDKIKKDAMYSYVASQTSCGGNAITEYNQPDGYYLLPAKQNDFTALRNCVTFYLSYPEVLSENAKITIYNTGFGNSKTNTLSKQINTSDWLNTSFDGDILTKKPTDPANPDLALGNYILDVKGTKSATTQYLAKKYNATIVTKAQISPNIPIPYGTDIIFFAGGVVISPIPSSTPAYVKP